MGWLFTQDQTKKELIAHLTKTEENDDRIMSTVAKCVRGHVLWVVYEVYIKAQKQTERFIGCNLMKVDYNPDGSFYGWGYKDMTESMGPAYYSCPLKYLDITPLPKSEYAEGWREQVRAYHAKVSRKFKVGDTVTLPFCQIPTATLVSLRPLIGVYGGGRYRIKKRYIGEVVNA